MGEKVRKQLQKTKATVMRNVFSAKENRRAWPAADWKATNNLSIPSQVVLNYLGCPGVRKG